MHVVLSFTLAFSDEEDDVAMVHMTDISFKERFVLMASHDPIPFGEVVSEKIDGDRATLILKNGEVQMVKEDGDWKLLLFDLD